jgi:hypothetical protein
MWFSAISGVARILGIHSLPFGRGWILYALEEGAIQGDGFTPLQNVRHNSRGLWNWRPNMNILTCVIRTRR